jgi:Calcium-binding EGF domain
MRASQLSAEYAGNRVNSFSSISEDAILANITLTLFKGPDSATSTLPKNIQEAVIEQLRLSQRRLGTSNVYVGSLLTAVPTVQDINECLSSDLNDCPANLSICSNSMGSFSCSCPPGYADRHLEDPLRSGRICQTCEEAYCNQHGICLLDKMGKKICQCTGWYIGSTCQTDGQVVAVACGSSAIAVILIAITLLFLLRWRLVVLSIYWHTISNAYISIL